MTSATNGIAPAAWDELEGSGLHVARDEPSRLTHARDASRAEPTGLPAAVVTPRDTAEVAVALSWADRHRIPVSVRGGGSGLSGGAVAYADGLVISTAALTTLTIDAASATATVGAGVITAEVDAAAAQHGLLYGPDPVSREWSTIGGNVATNAGGPRCLARGVTAEAVVSLEVVLADGRIIRTGSATRKNSTGYDLTRLFVGSEGTLGVVTEATVRLQRRPVGTPVAFGAVFPSMAAAATAVAAIMAGEVLPDCLELMDRATIESVRRNFPDEAVLTGEAVLAGECVGPDAASSALVVTAACRAASGDTYTGERAAALLRTRERVNPALSAEGLTASCDVAVPIARLAEMFEAVQHAARAHGFEVKTFAHAGDGNLHPAVVVPHDDAAALKRAEALLDDITEAGLALGGVVSGEHGIGSLKLHHLDAQLGVARTVQQQIKAALDPHGILAPGRSV